MASQLGSDRPRKQKKKTVARTARSNKNPPMIAIHKTASHIAAVSATPLTSAHASICQIIFDPFDHDVGSTATSRLDRGAQNMAITRELEGDFSFNIRLDRFRHTRDMPLQYITFVVDVMLRRNGPPCSHEPCRDHSGEPAKPSGNRDARAAADNGSRR
jgi:hypothetical protein